MVSVASELKSEREKRKVTLAQIAAETRISLRYLQSLEEGRYGDLPGGIYNRAFLRAYCESIHLDQREIIRRYEEEVAPHPEKPSKHKPQRLSSGNASFKLSPVVLWSIMLLISVSGVFLSRKWIAEVFSPYVSHAPASGIRLKPETTPSVLPGAEPSTAPDSQSTEAPDSSPASQTASAAPGSKAMVSEDQDALLSSKDPESSLRLELAATETCWISVDRDGRPAVRKIMEPGEVQYFSAAQKFLVIIGNAGGVHLKINGKPAKQLGESGKVIRLLINDTNIPNLIDQTAG
jgi:cytoskeleton protein RodZ